MFCVSQEQLGKPVKLTMGEYTNLKLTTPEDMIVATTILESREENFVLEPRLASGLLHSKLNHPPTPDKIIMS